MEKKMCQQTKTFLKPSSINRFSEQTSQHVMNCHRCNMCSSYSSSPSLSSTSGSSSSSSSSTSVASAPVISSVNDGHHSKRSRGKKSSSSCFIQQHLQSIFKLVRREETLKMAVRLESGYPNRTRYLVVVTRIGKNSLEECCLLGIDCNQSTTVGLVLKVLADTSITLDGDGGFSVSVYGRQHIFKPVSVQAMWSALQTLYKISNKARESNYFEGGNTHEWVNYYEKNIRSDQSCVNEWHTMNDIESRRPPSPDSLRSKPRERLETERIIRSTLKEIMMSVDLDQVTSKYIRSRLEEQLDMDLSEYKPFIDQEMLVILGQMDEATEVFSHVYLGSEWNASNLEELTKNGICHILNVTREIDNFFPGAFDYMNVRVYDDDNTDLLKHWDNTYRYIDKVKNKNSKVLVHCKMGISRSASVVIAYAMKAYSWDFKKAFEFVRKKRTCIKPNQNFINQLETYQGILDAMKNREKLQRSKSETNLKSNANKSRFRAYNKKKREREEHNRCTDAQDKIEKNHITETDFSLLRGYTGVELAQLLMRPKSWSPDNLVASEIFSSTGAISQSLEQLNVCKLNAGSHSSSASSLSTSPPRIPPAPPLPPADSRYNLNVGMLCENGLTYSVSQNKILQLYSLQNQNTVLRKSDVKSTKLSTDTAESNSFALQLPSQFQSNAFSLIKSESKSNLVTKSISDIIVDSIVRKPDAPLGTKKLNEISTPTSKPPGKTSRRNIAHGWVGGSVTSNNPKPRYHNNERNASSSGDLKPRAPFEIIDSPQKVEYNSVNMFNNNNPPRKISTSQSTNNLLTVSSTINRTIMSATNVFQKETRKRTRTAWPTSSHHQRISLNIQQKEDETRDGKVSALAKKFEAKCNIFNKGKQRKNKAPGDSNNNDARSLPCSPINEPVSIRRNSNSAPGVATTSSSSSEVRRLVGQYDERSKIRLKNEKRQPPVPPRISSFKAISRQTQSGFQNQCTRAPLLTSTVLSNASVFNTM